MRIDGKMVSVPESKIMTRTSDEREQTLVQIPWADMVTSYVSTGIPTIEVYQVQDGQIPAWLPGLARFDFGRRVLSWIIDRYLPEGPPEGIRDSRQTRIVSTATNAEGEFATATLVTPEAYFLTFHSALIVAKRVLDGYWDPGFQTPAKMYGTDLVLEVPGVTRSDG
jgi:short subunit dehydrogenase-like uncharacterized protein